MNKETKYKIIIAILIAVIIGGALSMALFPEYNQKLKEQGQMELINQITSTGNIPIDYLNCRQINKEKLSRSGLNETLIQEIIETCKENELIIKWVRLE